MTRAPVPCGGCRACCKDQLIVLVPEEGDRVAEYEHEVVRAAPGVFIPVLRHHPNGDCVYLGESGCSIWDRAPLICRVFDCRRQYAELAARFGAKGVQMNDVLRAGRERLHSIGERVR
jgi:Fe-S-cluster containining protein